MLWEITYFYKGIELEKTMVTAKTHLEAVAKANKEFEEYYKKYIWIMADEKEIKKEEVKKNGRNK